MPRKPKAAPADPYERVCRNCKFYIADPEEPRFADCHLNPPVPFLTEDNGIECARPIVAADDVACNGFELRLNS